MKTTQQKSQAILGSTVMVVLSFAGCAQDNSSSAQRTQNKSDSSVGVSDDLLAAYQNGTFELTAKQHGHSQQFIDDIKLCVKTQPFLECLRAELDKVHNDYAATPTPSASASPTPTPDPSNPLSGCSGGTSLADASATYVFTTGIELKSFVSEQVVKHTPNASLPFFTNVSADADSASALCHLKGFATVDSSTKIAVGCLDYVATWNSGQKYFFAARQTNGCLMTLTCKGKLADSCVSDQSWIYQK